MAKDWKADKGDQGNCLPDQLPLIPLLSTVVFPGMIVNLQVSRERNLRVAAEVEVDDLVGLVLQTDLSASEPEPSHLSTIGVAARVINKVNVPGDTVQLILQGLRRFKITEFINTHPYLKARIRDAEEDAVISLSANVLISNAVALFEELAGLDGSINSEAVSLVRMNTEGCGEVADQISTRLVMRLEDKTEILEAVEPEERLRSVIRILRREIQVKKIGADIQRQTQDEIGKTQREYILRQQMKTIKKELGDAASKEGGKDLRFRIEASALPEKVRKEALAEMSRLEAMSPASAEHGVIRAYLETLVDLPWDKQSSDNIDLSEAIDILNTDHYGLDKVKERIVEFLAVRKMNPSLKGPILCLVGPPGTGKTSLGRSIARSMNREYARISVGGLRDEAEIRGHRRTYVGAMPGKIIQALRRAGTNNPVFVIDEIDKIGSDHRGDPASALLEVLDPEQNKAFCDLYLDAPFDLSRVMFVATANRLDTIPPALRDRLEIIELGGYSEEEKLAIARNYLIPRQRREAALEEGDLEIRDDAVCTILREYTRDAGVRSLERKIAAICRKVTTAKTLKKIQGTVCIESESVHQYLGPPRFFSEMAGRVDEVGVATGLAWTPSGGEILFVELSRSSGKGRLQLTGQLGDVMKESAQAAMSYVRAHAADLGIPEEAFTTTDLHLHVPAGGIPKDGPSAGIALVTAIASILTGRPVHHNIAMTGEISLRGRVLPVGGVREKILAARRAGLETVILPLWNRKDLDDVPQEVKDDLRFIFAENVADVLDTVLHRHAVAGVLVDRTGETAARDDTVPSDGSHGTHRIPDSIPGH